MKSREKLRKIGQGAENGSRKLTELAEDELHSVGSGIKILVTKECPYCGKDIVLFI